MTGRTVTLREGEATQTMENAYETAYQAAYDRATAKGSGQNAWETAYQAAYDRATADGDWKMRMKLLMSMPSSSASDKPGL